MKPKIQPTVSEPSAYILTEPEGIEPSFYVSSRVRAATYTAQGYSCIAVPSEATFNLRKTQ